jgi:hypothetical protein
MIIRDIVVSVPEESFKLSPLKFLQALRLKPLIPLQTIKFYQGTKNHILLLRFRKSKTVPLTDIGYKSTGT